MKLYAIPPSPNSFKVIALAHHLGLLLEVVPVDVAGGQNQSTDYLKINPNGLMPALEDGSFHLWESNAIMLYLAEKKPESGLIPADPQARAQVFQWMTWHNGTWSQAMAPFLIENIVKPAFRGQPPDAEVLAKAQEPFHKAAKVLEGALAGKKFLVGEQLTLADFAVAPNLFYTAAAGYPLADYPNIQAYGARITGDVAFQKAIPPMPAPAR